MSQLIQDEVNEKFLKLVSQGKKADIISLLEQGIEGVKPELNATTPKGNSALTICFNKDFKELFEFFLDLGVSPDIQDNMGETVTMHAAKKGKTFFLQKLIDYKANLNLQNDFGTTALIYATTNKMEREAEMLINAGADVNIKTTQKASVLLAAANAGTLSIARMAIEHGANINDKDYYGMDALITAVNKSPHSMKPEEQAENLALCQFLIENNANVNYVAPSGRTALFSASMFSQTALVELLLNENANPNVAHTYMVTDNIVPLWFPCQSGDFKTVNSFLAHKADPNIKDSDGNSPTAFGFFHPELRQILLDNNADVNTILHSNGHKIPILSFVINSADKETFQNMVDKGVELEYQDKDLQAHEPLKLAITSRIPFFVEEIIQKSQQNLNKLWEFKDGGTDISISPLMFLVESHTTGQMSSFLQQKKMVETILKNSEKNQQNGGMVIDEEKRKQLQQELDKYQNIETEMRDNKYQIFDILLKNGADVNYLDKNGSNALFYSNDPEFTQKLIENNCNLLQKNNDGDTPLSWAIRNGRTQMVDIIYKNLQEKNLLQDESVQNILIDLAYTSPDGFYQTKSFLGGIEAFLKDKPEYLSAVDEEGNHPIIISCATGQGALTQVFLESGGKELINQPNKQGEIALFHAIANENAELVGLLLDNNADISHVSNSGKKALDIASAVHNEEIWGKIMVKQDPTLTEEQLTNVRKIKMK